VHSIIEAWELASIPSSRTLLHILGFDEEEEVNLLQLTKALEEELRGLEGDQEQSNMLRALAALQATELGNYRLAFRQQHEENLKLRADNKAANQRVALLAVEVDERHASLEDSSKQQVQQLEQRHASMVRELTLRMSNDRDHWTSMTGKLEAQLKSLEQEEIRLKTELELLRTENSELESEQQKAHVQLTELLEQNIKLNQELAQRPSSISGTPEHSPMRPRRHSEDKEEEMLQLMEKLAALQMENAQLRDKTDELTIEIESLNVELIRSKSKGKKQEKQEEQEAAATATKRRGDSPSKTHLTEESPRLGKQRKCTEGDQSDASNSGDWLALNSELQRSQSQDEELTSLRQRVADLEKELKAAKEGCHPLLLLAQNAKITFEAMIKTKHTVGHHLATNSAPSSEHRRCYHGGRWSCCKGLCALQQLSTPPHTHRNPNPVIRYLIAPYVAAHLTRSVYSYNHIS